MGVCSCEHLHINVDNLVYSHISIHILGNNFTSHKTFVSVYHLQYLQQNLIQIMLKKNQVNMPLSNQQQAQEKKVQDEVFFNNLQHYKPLCRSIQGTPLFLQNKDYSISIVWISILNCISLISVIIIYILSQQRQINFFMGTLIPAQILFLLILVDILYVLTQIMNPGIRNLSTISPEQYLQLKKIYCIYCENYRTSKMYHCLNCRVCIQDYDHHCLLLNRCIGGKQKKCFVGLLVSIGILFGGLFVAFIGCIYM